MKKIILYVPMVGLFGFLLACGNPSHNNDVNHEDTVLSDGMDAVPPVDTIRRDSTDTMGQPMPTPPLQ